MMEWSSIDKLDKALEEAIAENSITHRYLSPTDVVGSIPAQGEVYNIM
jgi:hypothetical protein